ncbi:hypothetical protein ABZP12_03680 [Xanthomonas euvesicatoria]
MACSSDPAVSTRRLGWFRVRLRPAVHGRAATRVRSMGDQCRGACRQRTPSVQTPGVTGWGQGARRDLLRAPRLTRPAGAPGQQATRLRLPPGGCGRGPESACTTRTVRFRACRSPRLATARDVREPVLVGQLATGRLGRVEQAGGGPFGVIHERVAVALEAEDHLVAGALGIVWWVGLMPGQQGGEQAHVGR